MTHNPSARLAYAVAIGGGAILWLATAAISGRTEAWDAPGYWSVTYPLSLLLAGGLGYWLPERVWRWGLAVMLSQAVMLALGAASFGLLPLGLALFGVLALPAIWVAGIGARIRLRRS